LRWMSWIDDTQSVDEISRTSGNEAATSIVASFPGDRRTSSTVSPRWEGRIQPTANEQIWHVFRSILNLFSCLNPTLCWSEEMIAKYRRIYRGSLESHISLRHRCRSPQMRWIKQQSRSVKWAPDSMISQLFGRNFGVRLNYHIWSSCSTS
jgi:hypothetical protein